MSRFDTPLKNLKIASPCSAEWNAMAGDDRKRFCGECKLNVYDLSGMTSYDAENLLRNSEGRLCVRFYQRADGTVLTKDCPIGWNRVKQRGILIATAALSAFLALFSGIVMFAGLSRKSDLGKRFEYLIDKTDPRPPIMGAIAEPSPTPSPKRSKDDSKQIVDRNVNESSFR